MEKMQQSIREIKKEHRKEKENIVEGFSKQINELEEKLDERTQEVHVMRSELKMVTDFQKQKTSMIRELENVSLFTIVYSCNTKTTEMV